MRILAVVAILVFAPIAMASNNQPAHTQNRRNSQQATAPTPISVNCNCNSQADSSKDKPQGWHKLVTWPEGIVTWAIILTLGAIIWQAVETCQAAKAALLNAQAVIDAERAWIMVDLELRDSGFEQKNSADGKITLAALNVICSNDGRSIAWVTEKAMVFKIVEALPQEPDFSQRLDIFGNEPEPLVPSPSPKSKAVEKVQPWIHGWRGDTGNLVTLYGFVRYRDIFGKTRETRFGYMVTIDNSLQRLTGYPKYNENA